MCQQPIRMVGGRRDGKLCRASVYGNVLGKRAGSAALPHEEVLLTAAVGSYRAFHTKCLTVVGI